MGNAIREFVVGVIAVLFVLTRFAFGAVALLVLVPLFVVVFTLTAIGDALSGLGRAPRP